MTGNLIDASDVVFAYDERHKVLDGVGMDLGESEIIGILGPNGSGKTTFVKCINRILQPRQGHILLSGEDIKDIPRRDMAKQVGFVPQNSDTDVNSPLVYDVVMMGRRPHMTWNASEKDEEIVWRIMEEFDVAHLASKHFDELSSGQTQRVLISRAVAQDAKVMLLDEPTSNLDVKYQMEVMNIIRSLVDGKGISACAIVHDLDLAMKYCDKVVLLHQGKFIACGPPTEVLTPENIELVYGVKAYVENIHGRYRVMID